MANEKNKFPAAAVSLVFFIAFIAYFYLIFFDLIRELKWFGGINLIGSNGNVLPAFYAVTFIFSTCLSFPIKSKLLPSVASSLGAFLGLCLLNYWASQLGSQLHIETYENSDQWDMIAKDAHFWTFNMPFFVLWALGWGCSLLVRAVQGARSKT